MTLFKQISLIMSLFLLFVLLSVMNYNFQSAKKYAQEELATTSQNTATYLSLSLSNTNTEVSEMSTMINAVFDSGDFQRIRLLDNQRKLLFQRTNTHEKSEVPTWFRSLYTLQTPHSSATISSGWNPVGTITVTPMLETTHEKLYNNFLSLLQSFVLFSLITFVLLFFLLRLLLRSLKKMTEQAEAVSNNNFIINHDIPSTTEFKEVTLAMNKMVHKVKTIFEREASSVKEFHKLLYTDPLTGLGNRNYFELKLNEYILSEELESQGVILSIFLEGVSYANTSLGHEKVDELLYALCSGIREKIEHNKNALLTRLDGTKTAIIFTNTQAEAIKDISQDILTQALVLLEKMDLISDECSIKLTQISYTPQDNVLSILDQINASFNVVQKNAILSIKNETEVASLSEQLVKRRLDEHQVSLAMQSVYDKNKNTLHQEAYVRLYDEENTIYEARDFIPMVQKLNMGIQLDKNVINHALKVSTLNSTEIAINLSIDFIQDTQALEWLKERLITQGKGRVLNFEISNHALLRYITQASYLATMLRELGHNFAIDRFSIESSGNLNYLQMIQPAYLKIDSHYLMDMIKNEHGVSNPALQILTDSIDTKIIATNIENGETKAFLQSAGINYFQGSFFGEMSLV